jgi:cation:H+ antiporter
MAWLVFLLSAVAVIWAGTKLSYHGDRLAAETGLGGLWVGVVLMAGATSLPELFTVASASLLSAPDLAAGDLFGAVMTNMFTLGLVDLLHKQKRIWEQAALEQALIATLAIALTGLAALFVLLKPGVSVWGVGPDTLLLLLVYLFGMRVVFRQEDVRRRQKMHERLVEAEPLPSRDGLRGSAFGFGVAAVALALSAPLLAWAAKSIAEQTGLSGTTIGASLVAITTSMPELVSTFAAVRLGAFDLAVGNLFGSNAFNMAALFVADVAYQPGPLLSVVAPAHAVAALWGILLMAIGLMGIIYRAERRFFFVEPDSLLMIVAYGIGLWLMFKVG